MSTGFDVLIYQADALERREQANPQDPLLAADARALVQAMQAYIADEITPMLTHSASTIDRLRDENARLVATIRSLLAQEGG